MNKLLPGLKLLKLEKTKHSFLVFLPQILNIETVDHFLFVDNTPIHCKFVCKQMGPQRPVVVCLKSLESQTVFASNILCE